MSTHRVVPAGGSFHSHTTDDGPPSGAGVAHARWSDPAGAGRGASVVEVVRGTVVVGSWNSVVVVVVVASWFSVVDVVVLCGSLVGVVLVVVASSSATVELVVDDPSAATIG